MTASFTRGPGKSFVDLERGIFYRLAEGKRPTSKRQTPGAITATAPRANAELGASGIVKDYFVEWNGKPVQSIKVGYKRAVTIAGPPGKITPHIVAPHGRDVAHAGRRTDLLGSRRVPRHVAGYGRAHLRASSPGAYARRGESDCRAGRRSRRRCSSAPSRMHSASSRPTTRSQVSEPMGPKARK